MRWYCGAAGEESVKIDLEWQGHGSFRLKKQTSRANSASDTFLAGQRPTKNGLHALQNELASQASRRRVRSSLQSKWSSVHKRRVACRRVETPFARC